MAQRHVIELLSSSKFDSRLRRMINGTRRLGREHESYFFHDGKRVLLGPLFVGSSFGLSALGKHQRTTVLDGVPATANPAVTVLFHTHFHEVDEESKPVAPSVGDLKSDHSDRALDPNVISGIAKVCKQRKSVELFFFAGEMLGRMHILESVRPYDELLAHNEAVRQLILSIVDRRAGESGYEDASTQEEIGSALGKMGVRFVHLVKPLSDVRVTAAEARAVSRLLPRQRRIPK